KHLLVKNVNYPGLNSHPQKELIDKQMLGYGGMLSFVMDEKVNLTKFFQTLKLFHLAVSLGGVESLIARPWSMSHASMSEKAREEAGIPKNLVRISAGIEDAEDLISDLENAFQVAI
ncbi:MAG TPA: PLP-dependent transferase, partial [Vampirovibrionales bacterium]